MPSATSLTALVDLDGNNLSVGAGALAANTGGILNVAIGPSALASMSVNSNNVGIGPGALALSSGDSNVAVGRDALSASTSGGTNTAVGQNALNTNTTGASNVGIGHGATCDSATASNQLNVAGIYRHNRLRHTPATLATLNAFVGLADGTRAICSDSDTVVFNATAAGGGGNKVPVWYNGTNWIVG